tara:strand:- start:803 stop:1222 length:420 start_codon:yes stop_codon:yes gene_type:complete
MKFKDILTGKIFIKDSSEMDLVAAPKKNRKFSEDFIEKTKYLHKVFNEVSPSTLERWLDDFDRDMNPEKELAIWMHMAKTYEEVIKEFPNELNTRKGIFQVLLNASSGMSAEEIAQDERFKQLNLNENDIFLIWQKYNS